MRLTTMWKVDSTVRDDGSSPIAEELLDAWGYDPGSIRFFRSSANFTYLFRRDGADHFLRFADDSERRREEVEAELEAVSSLARAGVPVAEPVPARGGEHVLSCATDVGLLHAAVFERVTGSARKPDELDQGDFRRWGASLGRLHAAIQDLLESRRPRRPSWEDHLRLVEAQLGDNAVLRAELDAVRRSLTALPGDAHSFGLIHGDFQLDNVFWNGALQIIDFDDCAYHWYAADIAFALDDVLDESGSDAFLSGYGSERAIGEDALGQIEMFRRAGDLVRYARIRRSLDLPDTAAYPDWLRELAGKLERHATAYEQRVGERAA